VITYVASVPKPAKKPKARIGASSRFIVGLTVDWPRNAVRGGTDGLPELLHPVLLLLLLANELGFAAMLPKAGISSDRGGNSLPG
jgi:hypothetical protein